MSNPSMSTGQEYNSPPCSPLNPATHFPQLYQTGYQQALDDFAVTDLLQRIKSYSDANFDAAWLTLTEKEAETLAALLIQTLTANLNGELLCSHLNSLRHNHPDLSSSLSNLQLPSPSTDFPIHFPDVEMPRFLYGDRLCWISDGEVSDSGIVIGRFYNFAPHGCRWHWCYLLWLDPDSPSAAWVSADIAWEDDLQPCPAEAAQ